MGKYINLLVETLVDLHEPVKISALYCIYSRNMHMCDRVEAHEAWRVY